MLRIELAPQAVHSRIVLDGQDISRFVKTVTVDATVGDNTHVLLAYHGPVVIEGQPGTVTLVPGQTAADQTS